MIGVSLKSGLEAFCYDNPRKARDGSQREKQATEPVSDKVFY